MAYSYTNDEGNTYYLHKKEVDLRGGRTQTIYYFAGEEKDGAIDEIPDGYHVVESDRTGLPLLKKEK